VGKGEEERKDASRAFDAQMEDHLSLPRAGLGESEKGKGGTVIFSVQRRNERDFPVLLGGTVSHPRLRDKPRRLSHALRGQKGEKKGKRGSASLHGRGGVF